MTLDALSKQAQEQYALYKAKKISSEEFKELMNDIAIQTNIAEASHDLEHDILCHNIIVSIVQLSATLQIARSFK